MWTNQMQGIVHIQLQTIHVELYIGIIQIFVCGLQWVVNPYTNSGSVRYMEQLSTAAQEYVFSGGKCCTNPPTKALMESRAVSPTIRSEVWMLEDIDFAQLKKGNVIITADLMIYASMVAAEGN